DQSRRVDAWGDDPIRSRRIQGGEGAVASAQEAEAVRGPGNRSRRIHACGRGEGRARNIERCQSPVGMAQEAMRGSGDHDVARRGDTEGCSSGRARRIEGGQYGLLSICGKVQPYGEESQQAKSWRRTLSSRQSQLSKSNSIRDHWSNSFAEFSEKTTFCEKLP